MSIAREGNQRLMSASILAITPAKVTRALVLYAISAILQTVIFFVNRGENALHTAEKLNKNSSQPSSINDVTALPTVLIPQY